MRGKALVLAFAAAVPFALPAHGYPVDADYECFRQLPHTTLGRAITACTVALNSRELHTERKPDFLVQRGFLYIEAQAYGNAIQDFDTAIKIKPSDVEANNGACWARAVSNRDLPAALDDCDAALKLRPGDSNTLDSRALVHFRSGEYGLARTDLDAALARSPQRAGSLFLRGVAKKKLRDVSFQADIDAALARDPAVAATYAGYGIAP